MGKEYCKLETMFINGYLCGLSFGCEKETNKTYVIITTKEFYQISKLVDVEYKSKSSKDYDKFIGYVRNYLHNNITLSDCRALGITE